MGHGVARRLIVVEPFERWVKPYILENWNTVDNRSDVYKYTHGSVGDVWDQEGVNRVRPLRNYYQQAVMTKVK